MNRLSELFHKKEQCLYDREIIIYVKDGEMIGRYNNGEELVEVSGKVDEKLSDYLKWFIEDIQN